MNNKIAITPISALVIGLSLFPASSVFAQLDGQRSKSIEEILVTARKRVESAQEIPISLTSISDTDLIERNVLTFTDLRNVAPSLNIQTYAQDAQTVTIGMRGQKQRQVELTVDQSVGVYVDGFYYARPMGLASTLVDAERVEVLRGPQGTLYGRNTTGGAISVYTADPKEAFGTSIAVGGGNYDARNVTGIFNIPLSENTGLRFVARRSLRDGFAEDPMGRQIEDEDLQYYSAKFKTVLNDKVTVKFSTTYSRSETGGLRVDLVNVKPNSNMVFQAAAELANVSWWRPGVDPAVDAQVFGQIPNATSALQSWIDGDYSKVGYNTRTFSVFEGALYLLDVDAQLTDSLSFRSITGFHDFKREGKGDFDGTPFQIISPNPYHNDEYFSQEFQLLGSAGDIDWVTGLYYSYEDGDSHNTGAPTLPALTGPLNQTNTSVTQVTNTSSALFAQMNWAFLLDWRLTIGGRYSMDEREITANNVTGGVCLIPAPGSESILSGPSQCPRDFDEDFEQPSWLISLDHQFSNDFMGFVKVAKGYRSGGLNQNGQRFAEAFESFDPEIVTEYEVGFKSDLFDNKVRWNLSLYYSDYTDIQRVVNVPTFEGSIANRTDNAADATVEGFESEFMWQATDSLSFQVFAGYTKAEFDEYDVLGVDRSDEKFAIPEWTSSVNGRYVYPLDNGEVTLNVDYYWQSETDYSRLDAFPDVITQDDYGLVNARLSIYLDKYKTEFSLFGRNIADKEYFIEANNNYDNLGMQAVLPGEPRVWGVQVKKTWGDL